MGLTREKKHGIHYTPGDLAAFLAERIVQWLPSVNESIMVLDPACGDGELLGAFVCALPEGLRRRVRLVGYDTDREAVKEASRSLSALDVQAVDLAVGDFLSLAAVDPSLAGGLFGQGISAEDSLQADVIISNPPYVRTQVLGAQRAQRLAQRFRLSGRVDLYHAFTMAMLSALSPGGTIGLLTSNRFLVTKAGASMRRLLHDRLDLLAVVDLGDTKLFEAAVLPAIVVGRSLSGKRSGSCDFTRVYEADPNPSMSERLPEYPSVLDALREGHEGLVKTRAGAYKIEKGTLSLTADGSEPWFMTSARVEAWMATVSGHTSCCFGDVAEVRVGIKTTADKVFIREDWETLGPDCQPEESLLHPLLTHHVAQRWRLSHGSSTIRKRVLYPHEVREGRRCAISLAEYPRAERYLGGHRDRLERRSYLREAGRKWYEIWVPQNPLDWTKAKIVWPDIAVKPCFFLERDGAVVNGDCYWMTLRSGFSDDWLFLTLAIANSTFIERFYDTKFHNKLYARRRRFITQYVNEFPLPDIASPSAKRIVTLTQQLLRANNERELAGLEARIDQMVWRAFGLRREGSE